MPGAKVVRAKGPATLCIDIGGTGLKMMVLDGSGKPINERDRVDTPHPATPRAVLAALGQQIARQPRFDRVSVGFPGVVVNGVTLNAPNLDPSFAGFHLEKALEKISGKPTRVCNDADVQGLAVVSGHGVELVITLGTGMGSGLYLDGRLVPNLELAHHVFRHRKTYEENVSDRTLRRLGKKKWRKRVHEVIEHLAPVFNYATLYVGGGNSRLLHQEDLPRNVKIVSNDAGILGGFHLWR
ncbi:MAG: ROK family protein [Alphaproteobacteria bacterium]